MHSTSANSHGDNGGNSVRPVSSFRSASSLPRGREQGQQHPGPNSDRSCNSPSSAVSTSAATAISAATTAGSRANGENGPSTASASNDAQNRPKIVQPKPQPRIRGQGSGAAILVNGCQRGNPILQSIRNVGWEYGDIVPDYQVGISSCVLFLSLRYHRLHPEYIHTRIQKLGQMFTLRVLLVMCDVNDHQAAIKELTKVSIVNNLTIMIAWNAEEAGRYVETYKAFEHKPPDLIKERVSDDYMSHLTSALTSIRGVNKTDVITLASNFGSLKRLSTASADELSLCPGFGEIKVRRVREAFAQSFRVGETRSKRQRTQGREEAEGSSPAPSWMRQTSLFAGRPTPEGETRTRTPLAGIPADGQGRSEERPLSGNENLAPSSSATEPESVSTPYEPPTAATSAQPAETEADATSRPTEATDPEPDLDFEGMDEEEQLALAMAMSVEGLEEELE